MGKNINEQLAAIINNDQMAFRMLDCLVHPFPFLAPMWMSYPTRTVIREAQEVPGTAASDCVAFALCWICQPFQLFMNAHYMPNEWIPEEFSCESLDLQECHDVETE